MTKLDLVKLEKVHEELANIKKYVDFERGRPKSKVDTVGVTFKTIESIAATMLKLADMVIEAKRIMQEDSITEDDRIEEWAEWLDKYNNLWMAARMAARMAAHKADQECTP